MKISYPKARQVDQVDEYHGVSVTDPYRWMEKLDDPELKPWLDSQEELTHRLLDAIPCRDQFRKRLEDLSRRTNVGVPISRGTRWFQGRNPGDLDQSALYLLDDPAGEGRIVLDPASFEGDLLLMDYQINKDGTLILIAQSHGGSDWRIWRVMDVDTGKFRDDRVEESKLWAVWLPDSSGFLYQRFPGQGGEGVTRATFQPQLFLHHLGTNQEDDELVYEDTESPHYFFPQVTDDGRHLVITPVMRPGMPVLVAPLQSKGGKWEFAELTTSDQDMWFVAGRGDEFLFTTTKDAPFGRVVGITPGRPDPSQWRTIVPERDQSLMPYFSCLIGDKVLAVHDYLGRSTVSLHSLNGDDSYQIELPDPSRFVNGNLFDPVGISPDEKHIYFTITQPTSPSTLLRHEIGSTATEVIFQPAETPDLQIEGEVVWAVSKDGTKVPMTLIRSAAHVSANPPVIIEGYGGGGDSMDPYDFSPWKLAWMEAGGMVGLAHIRGGRELGAEWQLAAARGGKLKAMEDFIGCAGYLSSNNVTVSERVGITGRSSGGMLAAAAAVAKPDLFAACVAEVGMFDPLRYHLFGLGRLMVEEYGTSENPEDFEAMFAYSPVHRVQPGTSYPAMLLTVHTDDDRVLPGSAFKFAATVQEAQTSDSPILLHLRSGAGHHAGPISGEIDERADILAFWGLALGLPECKT